MKQYNKYMDNIQVSDTLHQRLLNLEAPAKRPAAWKKYGAAAAALLLVCGVGAWGLGKAPSPQPGSLEGPEMARPDIAVEGPGESVEPGMKTIGGYEVRQGEMISYFMLPGIDYGMSDGMAQMSLDWDVPPGSVKRDLTQADFAALFGGEDALSTHLGWGGYTVTGWAAWNEDGSFWGAFINGYKGPLDHFELAFTAGDALPPTCIAYGEDGVVNQLWDVPVTAWGHDSVATPQGGVDASDRRVEFLHGGYGFRFDITGTSRALTEELVSRAARWLITEGVEAQRITADGTILARPDGDAPNYEDGVNDYDADCPYCVNGTAHTHPYDPRKGQDDPNAGNLPDGTDYH